MLFSLMLTSLLTFVELNCENLFDCRHDSLKNDIEFTPDGSRRWTERKYWNKLDNIGKALLSSGVDGNDWHIPDIVALCEVENDSVMRDLTKRSLLRNANYEYIITNSEDLRGIDVALMYHPGSFKPISHYSLRVSPLPDMRSTRDILYVKGVTVTADTLHIFVLHAPSRYGGESFTRHHRMAVMERLSSSVDSIKTVDTSPKIIVSGDFNDYHDGASLTFIINKGLINVTDTAKGRNGAKGTYKYSGKWTSIDHILISPALLPWFVSSHVNDMPFLLEEDTKYGGVKPLRTYAAYRYRRGYSDHLPLVLKLKIR